MNHCCNQPFDTDPIQETLPLHLPPEQLKARLADLIRCAVTQGTAAIAKTVARHFQALSLHPQLAANLEERAAYCRSARHWHGLAALRQQSWLHPGGVFAQEVG